MKKIVSIVLVSSICTMLYADIPPRNKTSIRHGVSISNAESFKGISIITCTMNMGKGFRCGKLKNDIGLSKYKFSSGLYLFAIKDKTLKKLGGLKALSKAPLEEAFLHLFKGLKSPMGISSRHYIDNDKLTKKDKNTQKSYEITEIKDGYLYYKLKESKSSLGSQAAYILKSRKP